ncbi:MAG: HAMP domain-containing histidine kinase, partial [Chloroflexi bacterium]|nr:HAMP domain-containing histidine kinase [Chloroflexota bacterium]
MPLVMVAPFLASPLAGAPFHIALALVLALFAALALTIRRTASERVGGRWMVAAGALVLAHAVLALTGSLIDAGWLPQGGLPVLEATAALEGGLLLGWPAVLPGKRWISFAVLAAAAALAIAGGTLALLAPLPAGWETVASLSLTGLSTAFLVLLFLRRPPSAAFHAAAFAALLLGSGADATLGIAGAAQGDLMRVGQLIAYPAFTYGALRDLLRAWRTAGSEPSSLLPGLPSDVAPSVASVGDFTGLLVTEDVGELADQLVEAFGRTLRIEFCALLTPPDSTGHFTLATGFDLIQERAIPGAAIDAQHCPAIAAALAARRPLALNPEREERDLQTLKDVLRLVAIGPGLLLPMLSGSDLHGGLLLLSPYARRAWSPLEQQALLAAATSLALRFARLKAHSIDYALAKQDTIVRRRRPRAAPPWRPVASTGSGIQEGGPLPDLDQLAGELQLALQELADTRAQLASLAGSADRSGGGDMAPDSDAITSMAQELRQPLSSILGYTELLLGDSVGRLGATQRQFVERIRTAIDRMRMLLSDLVQVTALEMGELTLTPAPIDLLHCIEEAVTQVGNTLREKDLGLRLDFPDEVPAVMGESGALVQILVHLLSNAAGASPDGEEIGVQARVIDAEPTGFLLLSVRDKGEG